MLDLPSLGVYSVGMRIKPPTTGQKIADSMNSEVEQLKAEIASLKEKIAAMRNVLWEWNNSSGAVWEYWKLKQIGEKAEDYALLMDEYESEMPLFGDEDNFAEGQ